MKRLLFIVVTSLISIGLYHWFSHGNSLTGYKTDLASIANSPGSLTDKPLKITARVLSAITLMNYTKCLLGDSTNHTAWLISNKPFKKGEQINVNAHLYILYQQDEQQYVVLVDDDLKIAKDVLHGVFSVFH
jgi:hypothetical protein